MAGPRVSDRHFHSPFVGPEVANDRDQRGAIGAEGQGLDRKLVPLERQDLERASTQRFPIELEETTDQDNLLRMACEWLGYVLVSILVEV